MICQNDTEVFTCFVFVCTHIKNLSVSYIKESVTCQFNIANENYKYESELEKCFIKNRYFPTISTYFKFKFLIKLYIFLHLN